MSTKSFTSLLAVLAISLISCHKQRQAIKKIDPEYARYVTGYTSGAIGRQKSIKIELADQYGNPGGADSTKFIFEKPDDKVLEGIFEFSPNIKGKAVWLNRREIEFIPDQILPSNQFYEVKFDLERVAKVKKGYESFEFQIVSYPQTIDMSLVGLKSYNSYGSEWMQLTGLITTADYEDTAKIKQVVKVNFKGKNLDIKWNFYSDNRQFYFYVDSIRKGETKSYVDVTWNGNVIDVMSRGEQKVEVPSLGDFTVEDVKLIEDDIQKVELWFSERLNIRQNLNGIVTVEGIENTSFSIEGNVVTVYFNNRIQGNKEIRVSTGIKNYAGHKMNESYSGNVEFQPSKPKVKLFGKGSILPNSQGLIFPFEAVSLKKVDVRVVKILSTNVHQFLQVNDLDGRDELSRVAKKVAETTIDLSKETKNDLGKWNPFVLDLSKIMTPEPGAIYRVSIKFKKEYAICDCDEEENQSSQSESQVDNNWSENNWNSWGFDDGYESWYDYYDDESPCSNDYYYGKAVGRNILASNIGMIYKLDEDKMSHAFISNLVTTEPIAGATVEYYDYTKHLIAKGVTNQQGMVDVPLKSKPFLMIASKDQQKGYLKLSDAMANSMSKFDVDGEIVQNGVKGFFYGERGVWRPGDSIYLNFILEDKFHKLPSNYPVKFELKDPNGTTVSQVVDVNPLNGFYSFHTFTSADAITGNYSASATVGNQSFYKTIMVETIKPNRLKIELDIPQKITYKKFGDTIGKLSAKWLHGADAPNLNARVEVSFSAIKTEFKGYQDFVFDSPLREKNSSNVVTVFDSKLDNNGIAHIRKTYSESTQAPGMLKATYITRIFESGGDFSTDRYSVSYSPYKQYLGMHIDDNNGWINTGKAYPLNVVAVDETGKSSEIKQVEIKVYKLEWRWWYETNDEDLSDFVSRSSALIFTDTVMSVKGKSSQYKLYFANQEYGRYLVIASDMSGGHQTGMVINVDWNGWNRDNNQNNENAQMLNFAIDKETYHPGDNIKVSVPSTSGGKVLITIENGKRVLFKQWYSTAEKETRIDVKVTEQMTPNAYIHAHFVQAHIHTKNKLPIRMYGVMPFTVDVKATHLEPVISCNSIWSPESTAIINVKESNGRPMTYTLAVVDDGLLDLTRFKTPQPWMVFYAKEALGVQTWDMYDQVIGAYAGKLDHLISIGGDGSALNPEGAKANRFKPMVRFIGPFNVSQGKVAMHKINIPSYVGSVRVMVVAGNQNGAYGNAEKTVQIKKPLMVLATLPRVLSPNESIKLPVDVFAMENHIKHVNVRIETNDLLQIEGTSNSKIQFEKNGDQIVQFTVKVNQAIGIAKVKVIAESGKEKASQEIELDVRIANPKIVESKDLLLKSGKLISHDVSIKGLKGTNKVFVEVSRVPSINLEKRLDYIIHYPHGCVEQTTSSVFPQLFVQNLMDLKKDKKASIEKNIKAGIIRLQKFQTSSGGFAYWPGESDPSEWGSNYAGHFLIEAEKMGYNVPKNMKDKWLKYQSSLAKSWTFNEHSGASYYNESVVHMQSYRLYLLALAGSPELGAMNRLREEKNLTGVNAWRLAATYELIGQHETALKISKNLSTDVKAYREYSYTYGSDFRDVAVIVEAMSLMGQYDKAQTVAEQLSTTLGSEKWLSTQETAYGLMAISSYTNTKSNATELSYSVRCNEKSFTLSSKQKMDILEIPEKDLKALNHFEVTNKSVGQLYVKILSEGIPLETEKVNFNNHINMVVTYLSLDGKSIDISKIAQGTDFIAQVSITNSGKKGYLSEMALTQIFPSGWEISNERFLLGESNDGARYKDYRDDRVNSYYEFKTGATIVIKTKLNATYLGKFYLPTVYTEAMYDKSINASAAGRWVEVVPQNSSLTLK